MDKENKELLQAIGKKCGLAPLPSGLPIRKRSATTPVSTTAVARGVVTRTRGSSPLHITRTLSTNEPLTEPSSPKIYPNEEPKLMVVSRPLVPLVAKIVQRADERILI